MDYEVAWSPEALDDVDAIAEYIARDSAFYAQAVVAKIIEASRTLADFPFTGRVVPELEKDDVRERFIYSYRLIYRIEEARILIVAVIHGKRLLEPAKERFDR
jgi:addiction module RelE/StbE family toxin